MNWLSFSDTSGTIVAGSSQEIEIEFNAAELDTGLYDTEFFVLSNDPDEPSIEIPVHLDVDMLFPDIAVSPDSLSEELYVGDSSIQSLTIYNNGEADLVWTSSIGSNRTSNLSLQQVVSRIHHQSGVLDGNIISANNLPVIRSGFGQTIFPKCRANFIR